MGRTPCSMESLNRGAWTALEDQILLDYIKIHGEGRWPNVPKKTGLKRRGKSCRLRWLNYLRPDIKRGNISLEEEDLIIRLHRLLGNRLPGRMDNEIESYWNSTLRKKVQADNSNESKNEKKPIKETCLNMTKKREEPSISEGLSKNIAAVSESGDGLLPITCRNDNSWDFMMGLNVEQVCLYEIIHSDFSKLCEFNNMIVGDCNNGCGNQQSSSSLEQPAEMLKNWIGDDTFLTELALDP